MSSQLIHNVSSKPSGYYSAPAFVAGPPAQGVISRYDIVSLGDNSKVNAIIEVTNKGDQPLDIQIQESDASVNDNGWPDYTFEQSFADVGSSETIQPMGSKQFSVSLTKKHLQVINKTVGVGGSVFLQTSFPKDVTEIGRSV